MNNNTSYKQAQLPPNGLCVGIDPHKKQHTVSVRSGDGRVLAQFQIRNGRSGFENLLARTETLRQQQGATTLLFAIEPGGHYWRTLDAYLQARHYAVYQINPFTLKRQREGDDLNQRKNDYRDAAKAAELLQQGKYTWTQPPQGHYAELRRTYELYQQVRTEYARTKMQLTTLVDQLFPEFQSVFKQLDGQSALTVLAWNAQPAQLAAQDVTVWLATLRSAHRQAGRRGFQAQKLCRLHAQALTSVGLTAGACGLNAQVQLVVMRLSLLQRQRQTAERLVRESLDRCAEKKFLTSLVGLGELNAAGLLAHIGDVQRFSNVKQLTKLAGIQPIEERSAATVRGHTPMSKKGRSGLRHIAFQAVIGLLRHNAVFQLYVQRLHTRAFRPLHKRAAVGAAMNKLLRIVYTLLKRQEYFDPQKARNG
jgi:transposase